MRRAALSTLLRSVCLPVALATVGPMACIGKRRPKAGAGKTQAKVVAEANEAADPARDEANRSLLGDARARVLVSKEDPARGPADALVTIVLFSDFECPFCARLAKTVDTLLPKYGDDLRVVFKHYPLPSHANAEPAAKAAVAAHRQGKFWEMHDMMFANQAALGSDALAGYARSLGLDLAKYTADIADVAVAKVMIAQIAAGRVLEVSTTPTAFVNGRLVTGAKSEVELRGILDEELAIAKKLVAAGTPRANVYAQIMNVAKPGTGTAPDRDPTHRRGDASKKTNYAISIGKDSPTRGPADALVTIVEFNHFACEACIAIQPHLQKILAKYPEDVRLVWRHFRDETTESKRDAISAAAAHKHGKFWEMHDKLFAEGKDAKATDLVRWANGMGIEHSTFLDTMRDEEIAARIEHDEAVANGLRGTAPPPFLWVNGRIVDSRDDPSFETIDALVLEEKAKAEAFMKDNRVGRAELYEAMRATWRGFALINESEATG